MNKVKVLIEGYAKETGSGWFASSTTVLIEDNGKKIIVDPGINKDLLLKKLKAEGLSPIDINIVFMTHYHPDHAFLAPIFEKAIIVDGDTIYEKDKETEYEGKVPGTNLEVISTPGHAHEHCALLVKTEKGKIVIAGDVFWWEDNQKQKTDRESLMNHEDPYVKNKEALMNSRKKILEISDYIIPGHGKMFKSPK